MSNGAACTLYDVARAAGVSTATVSRVVHGKDRVRSSTRQRVLEVIEELGYVPDGAAQSMARHRKEVIGLVTMQYRGPETGFEQEGVSFIQEVLRGVEPRPAGNYRRDRVRQRSNGDRGDAGASGGGDSGPG